MTRENLLRRRLALALRQAVAEVRQNFLAIAAMLARVMSSGSVPNCVLVSDVLKPARS